MRRTRFFGGLLALLTLLGLVIIFVITFRGLRLEPQRVSQVFQAPIQTPTQPSYPPPATPTLPGPPPTPTTTSTPVPRCTFAARPVPVEPAPPLGAYQFSEPQVVLTHTSAIGVPGWLPDGQRLLITRRIPTQAREYVETFDVQTGELQRYGERHSFDAKPVWLTDEKAVAFADVSPDKQIVLRISRGQGVPVEEERIGLADPHLAASPDGRQVVFFTKATKEQPEAFDVAHTQVQSFAFTLPWMSWQNLPDLQQRVEPTPYQAAWQSNGNHVIFYNNTGLYLVDIATLQVCEADLGLYENTKRWTFQVQWSPNGRYLAALTTVRTPPVHFSDLTLIDTDTGEQHRFDFGIQYVTAMTWAPNGRDILVVGETGTNANGLTIDGLFVVDATTGEVRQILTEHQFVGTGAWGVAWSPDGKMIALACPVVAAKEHVMTEGRLCIVAVVVKQ